MEAFDDSMLTKLINAGGSAIVCCQLWAEGGGPVWKQVKVPENGETGLLLMPVRRRMRRRSRVDLQEGREPEWQSLVWPPAAPEIRPHEWTGPGYGPSKSMEVVLGGVTKEVNGRRGKSS